MARDGASAIAKLRAVFFDFDSTISTPTYLERVQQWAVADKLDLFTSMTSAQRIANFGGAERIRQLDSLFGELKGASISLFIVSIGHKRAILPHLETAGLLRHFDAADVYGQDCDELRSRQFVKGALIKDLMAARGWSKDEALFVDDSIEHIKGAAEVCRTLHLPDRGGMKAEHFEAVRRHARA